MDIQHMRVTAMPHDWGYKVYKLTPCDRPGLTTHTKLKELLREPREPFRHMAPSAPSKGPLVLYVAAIMAPQRGLD